MYENIANMVTDECGIRVYSIIRQIKYRELEVYLYMLSMVKQLLHLGHYNGKYILENCCFRSILVTY